MNIKVNLVFLISIVLLVFTMTSCHFGFPDCEDDSNISVLRRQIAGDARLDVEDIKIDNYVETGLSDLGVGSNSFTCECKATYKASNFKGTIKFSVTRKNSNYSTRILKTRNRGYQKVLREGEKDSLASINKVYYEGTKKNAIEYLNFRKVRPNIGKEYTLFIDGKYSNYKLTSIIPLYRPGISYDSASALDEYKFSELLFEFRHNNNICLYAAKLESETLKYFDKYSYRINQNTLIKNANDMQKSVQYLRCSTLPSFEIENYIVLFNSKMNTLLNYDSTNTNMIWKVDLAYDDKDKGYYYLYKEKIKNIQKRCWEQWE